MALEKEGPASPKRTKPGSRSDRIFQLIADLCRGHERGVAIAEIREAYATRIGDPPKSLTSEVRCGE